MCGAPRRGESQRLERPFPFARVYPPALVLLPCRWTAAGCLLGTGSAGEMSNPAQQGNTRTAMPEMHSKPPPWGHHPATPGHPVQSPGATWEKLGCRSYARKPAWGFRKSHPPQLGRGMLWRGPQGAPTKAPRRCPGQSRCPCRGMAMGKQAPTRAAIPPACSLPSSLPVLPGPARLGRAGCSGCQNLRGATCPGTRDTFSLPFDL